MLLYSELAFVFLLFAHAIANVLLGPVHLESGGTMGAKHGSTVEIKILSFGIWIFLNVRV